MNLDRALEIAIKAHAGQTDKIGEPYILHPLRIENGLVEQEQDRMDRYQRAYQFLTGRTFSV